MVFYTTTRYQLNIEISAPMTKPSTYHKSEPSLENDFHDLPVAFEESFDIPVSGWVGKTPNEHTSSHSVNIKTRPFNINVNTNVKTRSSPETMSSEALIYFKAEYECWKDESLTYLPFLTKGSNLTN